MLIVVRALGKRTDGNRLSGKRAVKQASVFDFTMALALGDLIDDVLWAEVAAAQFVTAAAVLTTVHTAFDVLRFNARAGGPGGSPTTPANPRRRAAA